MVLFAKKVLENWAVRIKNLKFVAEIMKNVSFAYYRLPYSDHYHTIESERDSLLLSGGMNSIGRDEGFLVVPFVADMVYLIRPDRVTYERLAMPSRALACGDENVWTDVGGQYVRTFGKFHHEVKCGRMHKLVLARKKDVQTGDNVVAKELFLRACAMYPRLMIMMFHTPQTGTWLVASPEILVEGKGTTFHTIALAGTMPYDGGRAEWSEKNRHEQNIVERYIGDILNRHCKNITLDGPVTMRAGNLVHLRSDFHFQMNEDTWLGTLISDLHPTPAVCGLPKLEAREFILQNEALDRSATADLRDLWAST